MHIALSLGKKKKTEAEKIGQEFSSILLFFQD